MTDLTQNPHLFPLNYDDNDRKHNGTESDDSSIDSDMEVDDLQQTLSDNFVKIDIGSVGSSSDDEENVTKAKKDHDLKKLNEK
ncbi:unnamed protein product [Didymodactylos carnosus]|uniref:Uncharacterized protein n=1 Tax=Didymodactylos carnosus TaxID=1234261 RepID=A0A814PBT4_9BILA|nr:unnamed protein product [Didymodactylos carnosus]CAF1105700.1 unnamed protein product [Didymodactylos carnosus]CAF3573900.1 unnamed protein product [Didymodactylos carnosus]CAF3870341.1 unnamed protein product [Didymodactylos carnosus]